MRVPACVYTLRARACVDVLTPARACLRVHPRVPVRVLSFGDRAGSVFDRSGTGAIYLFFIQ